MQLPEPAGLRGGEADGREGADGRSMTQNASRRTLAPAQDCQRRGRGREQRDDDGAVAGRGGGEREGGQQREADDDAAGDDGERAPTAAPRGSRCRVSARAKAARTAATTARPGSDEQRRQALDRHPGERNGEGEGHDAERGPTRVRWPAG